MGLADQIEIKQQTVEKPLTVALLSELSGLAAELGDQAEADLGHALGTDNAVQREVKVHLKYEGTDTSLELPMGSVDTMCAAFESAYRRRYSFLMPNRRLIVEAVAVEARRATEGVRVTGGPSSTREGKLQPKAVRPM